MVIIYKVYRRDKDWFKYHLFKTEAAAWDWLIGEEQYGGVDGNLFTPTKKELKKDGWSVVPHKLVRIK